MKKNHALLSILSMLLVGMMVGCSGGQQESRPSSSGSSETSTSSTSGEGSSQDTGSSQDSESSESSSTVAKLTPTITFSVDGQPLDLSDSHWINESYTDSQYTIDELPSITFTVEPASLTTREVYANDEAGVESATLPTAPGTYSYTVTTVETDEYESASEYVLFTIIERDDRILPVITFYKDGEAIDFTTHDGGNRWVNDGYSASKFNYGEQPTITWSVDPVEAGGTLKMTVSDVEITEIPNEDCNVIFKVTVPESEQYKESSEYVMMHINKVTAEKITPVITFYKDGESIDFTTHDSGNRWVNDGYSASKFNYGEQPTITWSVDPVEAGGTLKMTVSDVEITEIPNEDCNVVYKVIVAGTDLYNAVEEYVMLHINHVTEGKVAPKITFFRDGTKVDTATSHFLTGSSSTSKYVYAELPEITWSVDPAAAQSLGVVVYTNDRTSAVLDELPQNPAEELKIRMTVSIAETDDYADASEYVIFYIKPAPTKTVPVITFYLNGVAVDIAGNGNHALTGSWSTCKYLYAELPEITWDVEPAAAKSLGVVEYANDRNLSEKYAELPQNPSAELKIRMTVSIAETDDYAAASEYVIFYIKAAA